MSQNNNLLQANIDALGEGAALLALLKPEQYTRAYKPTFHSTIGAHFRHVLEHYRCFIRQLETGIICYDDRERDLPLERDFAYANQTLIELQGALRDLEQQNLDKPCQLRDQQATESLTSTVFRELLFLQSHTMHHYAIIGAMTRTFGAQPSADFGVAIATREHQKSTAESIIGDSQPCAQ
ncbi:MAG: DinB family protein [Arenicella sp.]|nr:DinB family protein [Arenicella sp.]